MVNYRSILINLALLAVHEMVNILQIINHNTDLYKINYSSSVINVWASGISNARNQTHYSKLIGYNKQ